MKFWNKSWWLKLTVLLAGVTFLNMSFILTELDALGFKVTTKSTQNTVTGAMEEEQESSSESEESDPESELFLSIHQELSDRVLYLIASHQNNIFDNLKIHSAYIQSFSPPPEQSILI
jgi:hypothetical protein